MYVTLEKVSEFMYQYFDNVGVYGDGTSFNAKCALCGDSEHNPRKRRFYLTYNYGEPEWCCHNCGRGSKSFISLYCELTGVTYKEALKELCEFDRENISNILAPKNKLNLPKLSQVNHDYILNDCVGVDDAPDGIIQTKAKKELISFIKNRKLSPTYKIYSAYKGDYKNRIIIPVIKNDHIIYFQARTLTDQLPKYKNPSTEKECIILNEENFDADKYIIVAEGILDAYSVGDQGTTMFGASLNEKLLNILKQYTTKGIIVCFDNDTRGVEELHKILEKKYAHSLTFFIMPHKYIKSKDINSLSVSYNIDDMYEFIVDNSYDYFQTAVKIQMGEVT